jgi:hypothetical protein
VRRQRRGVDVLREETVARPAKEKPVLHAPPRFLTGPEYARRIRAAAASFLVLTAVLAAAGCGNGSEEQAGPPTQAPSTSTSTTAATNETTTDSEPLAGAATTPVSADPQATDTALVRRVAVGHHEGFDRVVFEFTNGLPGYRVEYVQPPLKEDGSGNPVPLDGDAFVEVRMEPASGFDLSKNEGELVYKGPRRIEGSSAGTSVVRELARTGDFEAVLSWAIGLGDRVPFRVTTAQSPARLIVDFRND